MTNLVMTLLVRDNADIVAANMDFHLAMGVDHIVVTNNRSEDATRDIVLDYVRRGVATIIDEFDDDYDQSAWVTRMARRAAREEGMLIGLSSGATLAAIAQKLPELPKGAKVIGFNYDTGERYLSVEGFLPAQ